MYNFAVKEKKLFLHSQNSRKQSDDKKNISTLGKEKKEQARLS